jgi:hypothetical protein
MANRGSEVYRAPNGKFYALWQGQLVCAPAGVLVYFETEHDAQEFLRQSDIENRVVDFSEVP